MKAEKNLVDLPAVQPNLPGCARGRAEASHLHHGITEIKEKSRGIGAVKVNLIIGGATVEELLIGVENPHLANQILEVTVVKGQRSGGVERREVVVAAGDGAV